MKDRDIEKPETDSFNAKFSWHPLSPFRLPPSATYR